MSEKQEFSKKSYSPDWFVHGVLTKIGDMFDRLVGRGWKPSSSLATSELIEKLKRLLDSEVRVSGDNRSFVPHNIALKMQWDKFSTDDEDSLGKLETELLTAVIDHINDRRYYTYAPITLEVKPDYFTSGVRLFAGFERQDEEEGEIGIDAAVPLLTPAVPKVSDSSLAESERVTVRFDINGRTVQQKLLFREGHRLSVGRTKENNLAIDDTSVSKMHASIMLDPARHIVVADTGSTNGTFVGGKRIPYGKAITIGDGEKLKFGSVEVGFEVLKTPGETIVPDEVPKTGIYSVGDIEFANKTEIIPVIEQTARTRTGANELEPEAEKQIKPDFPISEKLEAK